jgi:hypothetical protein
MSEKQNWQLQPGIEMTPAVADDVAKISCALKSLSAFTTFVVEREDCPDDLKKIVEDGLDAMSRIFVW